MGLSSLERVETRTAENPSTSLSNPAAWLTDALGGSPTHSGVTVNERTAMAFAAVYACINVRSKDVAQLPAFVYERSGKDERTPARTHPVWKIMHDRPNPMMTPMTCKQTLEAHVAGWGNGYAEIEYRKNGEPMALWPLLPDRTKPVIRDGAKWYVTKVKEPDGTERNVGLPPDRVLHIPGLGFDGIRGYSVIQMARNAIGAGMAAEEFSARMFSNGATPRIALKSPNKLTPDARTNLKLSWDAAYGGLSNAHRTAILEEGLTVEKLGFSAEDAAFIESSKFGIEQMARFFDIPLMRLHSTTAITSWGTGLEQWLRAYLIHTIGPCLVQWEESANYSLFREEERSQYFVEFLREAFMQGDMAAQAAWFGALFQNGAMSPNQIARKLNMPTVGPEGDERFIPLNMIPLSQAGKAPEPAPAPSEPVDEGGPKADDDARTRTDYTLRQQRSAESRRRMQQSYRRVYEQSAGRVVTKFVAASRRAVERLEKDENVPAFQKWVREFFEKERSFMQDAFLPTTIALGELVAADVLASIGSKANLQRDIERFAQSYVEALAVRESGRNSGQLIALANEGDTAAGTRTEKLMARLGDWEEKRAGQIAQRESVQAGNAVARHVYELSGVARFMWVSIGDTCPYCESLNGKVVSAERPFLEAGEKVGAGDTWLTVSTKIFAPPAHRGCDCVVVAA